MSTSLVTGATGLVGGAIVRDLVARGTSVRGLVRSIERARKILPTQCELVAGDVTDASSVLAAIRDCEVVYHAAGLPEQWLRNPATFDHVNVGGTRNAVEAARSAGVRRFVYTSTIDIFEYRPGEEFNESRIARTPKHTPYERSKQEADALVVAALDGGLPAVFLHPSGVYGPAPPSSPGLTRAIAQIARGEVPLLLPGSVPTVYIDDIGPGHVLAAEKGEIGERFILHESAHTLADFAAQVCKVAGRKRVPPTLPLWCARAFAAAGESLARLTGKPPIVARGQVTFLDSRPYPCSARAQERLGWKPTPFAQGLQRTIDWLRRQDQL